MAESQISNPIKPVFKLAKRIIACLDIKNGRTVKGVRFEDIRDAGDPVELAKKYADEGADELVFLDISASHESRRIRLDWVEAVARSINIPFTVGGGIAEIQDVQDLLMAGADKISINSAAVRKPELIHEFSQKFGVQCVVVAIDARHTPEGWRVYLSGGRVATQLGLLEWALEAEKLGAGEILFTSMDNDGVQSGFALEPLLSLSQVLSIPLIASGGAGTMPHFEEVFRVARVDAALAAGVFHYGTMRIPELKTYLKSMEIPVRLS
ncbi:MAG: imidazole glycerol phosphate synthase subunit HisF [Cytophagales bacterium]|nr:MAG: imidazole glycerol phosphate synthase subunit HisF [Cytophagales bacterium]TAF59295.1 MAG: imidazole glycerol phosphate synthase subunit HisF [Cytophagales bacterium]